MTQILIVDDEPSICWGLRRLLAEEGHRVTVAASAEEGLRAAREQRPDAVFLDVRLPGMDGITALEHFRELHAELPIVVMTAFGNLQTAVQAVSAGVVEYLPKPFDLDDAVALVRRVVRPAAAPLKPSTTSSEVSAPDVLIGSSRAMQEVFKQIALAAGSDVSVLITGESGTGKELVARAIHRHSRRREQALLPVSLAALNPTVIESELFGHVRGAFTGADVERSGVFELAAGGTVFLDEIGDVPMGMQVKLLRTIERKEVQRVGDARPRTVDFRVVAATHRDLQALIASEQFRDDLYYRLSVYRIELPPLRERAEDIPELAQHFLRQCQPDAASLTFHPDALTELQTREWRGNVRELRNVVERAAIVARGREIGPESLIAAEPSASGEASIDDQLRSVVRRWTQSELAGEDANDPLHERLLQIVEPELLSETLAAHSGNRAAAADRLGIHRATLRQKLRRYEDGESDQGK